MEIRSNKSFFNELVFKNLNKEIIKRKIKILVNNWRLKNVGAKTLKNFSKVEVSWIIKLNDLFDTDGSVINLNKELVIIKLCLKSKNAWGRSVKTKNENPIQKIFVLSKFIFWEKIIVKKIIGKTNIPKFISKLKSNPPRKNVETE